MAVSNNSHLPESQFPLCPSCVAERSPASFYTSNYCRHRPPVLNEQYSRQPVDLEQSLCSDQHLVALGRQATVPANVGAADLPDLDSTLSELYEESLESFSTVKDTAAPIRNDIHHLLCNFDHGFDLGREVRAEPQLTQSAIATLALYHAREYQHDVHGWALGQGITSAMADAHQTAALVDELNLSMVLAEKSTTSSHSDVTGWSWYLVGDETSNPITTDHDVRDTGGQFVDDTISPLPFDEML
ncbi:hypothetical protein Micbo1qcDRAFT_172090 [Microdochium bolleyi]|uniref:Uncharacterized protein n=1 Tax=Microdochium bolleyi TaxID=196109 RepID=A0A136JGK3_9PEZI|nr:hypothetical protein Micbo1qcDRAFT_172090 [Microdochium bolleyi]